MVRGLESSESLSCQVFWYFTIQDEKRSRRVEWYLESTKSVASGMWLKRRLECSQISYTFGTTINNGEGVEGIAVL